MGNLGMGENRLKSKNLNRKNLGKNKFVFFPKNSVALLHLPFIIFNFVEQ
jgi:hypothetical protein